MSAIGGSTAFPIYTGSHIWFLRGLPSRIGMVLDIPMQKLEKVIYFAAYIVTSVNEEAKKRVLEEIKKEYKIKVKKEQVPGKQEQKSKIKEKKELKDALDGLKAARDRAKEEINSIKALRVFSEVEYYDYSLKYGEVFEAGTGAETLRKIFEKFDVKKEIQKLKKEQQTK